MISGARYSEEKRGMEVGEDAGLPGVPHNVHVRSLTRLANPKSV